MRTYPVAVPGGSLFVYEWGEAKAPALLYWDGLGGTGLHANEIAPVFAEEHSLRVIALDPPGHGRSSSFDADVYGPSSLAGTAAALLSELGVERAAFAGFSWGGRVGCWFAALFPERTAALALIEGGHHGASPPTGLQEAIAEAKAELEEETFESWDAYFAYERESLRRWTPALEGAHRAAMREEDGRVVPIVSAEVLGSIDHGNRLEPLVQAYPAIAAARLPVLLVVASRGEAAERFRAALPEARIESIPGGIHDLVSFAPERIAELVSGFVSSAAEASRG